MKAAEILRVRQPSVSLIVQSLQRELDVKLFERLGQKTRLTIAGEELLRRAEKVLADVDGMKEAMDEIKGLKRGKLIVGGSAIAGSSFLPIAIEEFKKEHRGVDIFLEVDTSRNLERKILEGDLDLAVLGQAPRSALLTGEPYREEEIMVVAPANHPLTKKRSVPLEVLAKESLITYQKGTVSREMLEQRFAEKGLQLVPQIEVKRQMGSREAVKKAVVSGLGIGFFNKCHIMLDIGSGRLKLLRVPDLQLKRTTFITVSRKRQGSPLIQAFVEFLKHYKD